MSATFTLRSSLILLSLLTITVIATDGIAVIVNKDNKINELGKAKVADIFMGKTTEWKAL